MKKACFILMLLLVLSGCSPQESVEPASQAVSGISGDELLGVRDAASVEINGGDAWGGSNIRIDDPDVLQELTDMVCTLHYTKGEKYVPMVGCGYRMAWFDANNKPLASVDLGTSTILYGDYYYEVADGRIELSRLEELLQEYWPFLRIRQDWAILRDEETGVSMNLPGGVVEWLNQPFEKAGPSDDSVKGYTLELYDEKGELLTLVEHITATGFCMDGNLYKAVYESGPDVEQMGTFLAASQGDDEALTALDIKAVTIDNKEHTAYIEDRDVIKEVIAMFAGMEREELSEALSEDYFDYDFEIQFIEGFSEWSLYSCRLFGSHVDAVRLNELAETSPVERVFPEDYLYFHDINHIELTGIGKTVEIKGDGPLSQGMNGPSLSVTEIFRDLRVEEAGPAEEGTQEVFYTIAWVDAAGDTRRKIEICADSTLLYDGCAHSIVYGYFDTSVLLTLLEGDGKLPMASPLPTGIGQIG